MPEPLHPTPYAGINAVLQHFLASIQAIVGSHFRGMYLSGSLALGDFDPRTLAHVMGYTCLQSRFAVPAACQDKGRESTHIGIKAAWSTDSPERRESHHLSSLA